MGPSWRNPVWVAGELALGSTLAGGTSGWTTHGGLNCWDGNKGAIRMRVDDLEHHNPVREEDELEEMSLIKCKDKCYETEDCEGVLTIHRHVEPDQPREGPCWLRRNIDSSSCIRNTPWDLHVLNDRVECFDGSCLGGVGAASDGRGRTSFDCEEGLQLWKSGWSDRKKEWCCEREAKGCDVKSFSCDESVDGGWSRWGEGHRAWCCERYGGTSSKTYASCRDIFFDCQADWNDWKESWSHMKMDYCCALVGKGCWSGLNGASFGRVFGRVDVAGVPLWQLLLAIVILLLPLCMLCWLVVKLGGCRCRKSQGDVCCDCCDGLCDTGVESVYPVVDPARNVALVSKPERLHYTTGSLAVDAPGYGPMVVHQSFEATAPPQHYDSRWEYGYVQREVGRQFQLAGGPPRLDLTASRQVRYDLAASPQVRYDLTASPQVRH